MSGAVAPGTCYPNRRTLHGAGGRWSADLEGYRFDEAHAAAAQELAEQLGLRARLMDVEPEELAPPSYAERRATRTAKHARNADRYAARADSREQKEAGVRAELERDPRASDWQFFTEPIKGGHHSERRHRRDRERISAKLDKAHTLWREVAELRGKAAAAAGAAQADAERPAAFMVRRMEELGAELRKTERRLAGTDHDQIIGARIDGREPEGVDPESDWGKRLLAHAAELAEGLAYWQALLDARGGVSWSKATVQPGDIITKGAGAGGRARVVRTNAKTVSVVFIDHPLVGWKAKVPYAEILEITR